MNISAKKTAFFTAILSALIIALIIFFIVSVDGINWLVVSILSALLVFIVIYFVNISLLNFLIYKKINPLYKTIKNINFYPRDFNNSDILDQAEDDVSNWSKKKTLEITQLKQLEKYRREFLGNVSHELKTPIFNIQGYISTLLDGALEDKNVNRQYLERAEKSINRLILIVNDLESISRLESGELKLEVQDFNIVKLIRESFELHELMASEMEIKLKFAHKFDKPVMVIADRKKIYEVINNLVTNSIKYGKRNGTTIVDLHDMDESIMVEITDNGIGIAEKDIPRIFERFYRTDKSRSREKGGTGLGLAIVKHIIEAHKQIINVSSKKGEGSTFTFTLKKKIN